MRVKPKAWSKRLEEYKELCRTASENKTFKEYKELCRTSSENKTLADIDAIRPLDTDVVSYPSVELRERPFIELENPEWAMLARNKRISLVAFWLSNLVSTDKESMAKFFPHKNVKYKFSFRAFRDDVLLLDDAREYNGQCEFFISFAFLAPRAIKARKLDKGF